MNSTRRYDASSRQQKAQENRDKILDAASALFSREGVDNTSVAQIAEGASVAAPTVYAQFSSKAGIVLELLKRARFGPAYERSVKRALAAPDPRTRLRLAAGVARSVYESEHRLLELWRSADSRSPELAQLIEGTENSRRENQAPSIDWLIATKSLKPGLKRDEARDIMWALTSRDLYRLLVVQRGWSGAQYQRHVGDLLLAALVNG
jgi:AcrR family transcriptional regulator